MSRKYQLPTTNDDAAYNDTTYTDTPSLPTKKIQPTNYYEDDFGDIDLEGTVPLCVPIPSWERVSAFSDHIKKK
jgi:hypothetical protein